MACSKTRNQQLPVLYLQEILHNIEGRQSNIRPRLSTRIKSSMMKIYNGDMYKIMTGTQTGGSYFPNPSDDYDTCESLNYNTKSTAETIFSTHITCKIFFWENHLLQLRSQSQQRFPQLNNKKCYIHIHIYADMHHYMHISVI